MPSLPGADAGARARIRRELAVGDQTPLIGLIGRVITAIKGQDLMLRAMPAVLARCPDAVLGLVGDGPDLETCRTLAADLGVEHATRFIGHRNDVPDVLAAIDIAAVPSMCDEGFSFVALEALAAGRPVVAFRSGGVPEIVQHDVSGIIVAKGDLAAWRTGWRACSRMMIFAVALRPALASARTTSRWTVTSGG